MTETPGLTEFKPSVGQRTAAKNVVIFEPACLSGIAIIKAGMKFGFLYTMICNLK